MTNPKAERINSTPKKLALFWERMQKRIFTVYCMRRLITPAIRECLFLLGVWKPAIQAHASAAKRFAEVNRQFWASAPSSWASAPRGRHNILVEGHLAEYGPNYLFRTGLAAKAIQTAINGGEVVVVVNGFSYQWQIARECYRSFGITNWIFLGRKFLLVAPFLAIVAGLRAAWSFIGLHTPRQLIDLKHGGIKVGDLVYDEILRRTKLPTIQSVGVTVFVNIARSWYYYYQYHLMFTIKKFHFYVATHTAYPEYGLLCRVALQRSVTVIETSDIQMSSYQSIGEGNLPTYHQGINLCIRAALDSDVHLSANRETLAKESLKRRFNSESDQIDAIKAYSGKVYKRSELLAELNIAPNEKIGFVLTHIFVDSPHLSNSMLHTDYYDWLVKTIDCCAETKGVVWLVKPHPSCALYGEEGMVDSLVRDAKASNIFMCPVDLNTRSLATCADVILTVHGTAGLEFSCLGIPAVLAGTPFYAGFGFTHEPKSMNEYREIIKQAVELKPLSPTQISNALQVFGVWETVFDWNNPIITSELLANVWGNGTERNLERAYDILSKNLSATDPRDLKLWSFASSAARDEQSRT